jgi:hypothetical protein
VALDNYTNLQAAIAAWMDRSDLTGVIPDFVTLFETTANAELPLRTRFNLATATLTTAAGAATVALPSDFLEAKALINQTDPKEVLANAGASQLYTAQPHAATGRPKGYTYTAAGLELAPTPDSAYSLKLYYYQRITALSAEAPGNWLLATFPNLYLFGSLVAAEAYLGTDPRLQLWKDLSADLIAKLAAANERGQFGGTPLMARSDRIV